MELLHVWIESYGNIKRQGFNFSPNYDFQVKEQENGEYILVDNFETSGKKKQPENFFGDNISNITAIVGKNGSGKSTLLNAIMTIDFEGIVIFKKGEEKEQFYKISSKNMIGIASNIKFDKKSMENKGIYFFLFSEEELKKDIHIITERHKRGEDLLKSSIIYYDNIFNPIETVKFTNYSLFLNYLDFSVSYEFFNNNNKDELKFVSNETKNFINCLKKDILPKADDKTSFIKMPKKLSIINEKITEVSNSYGKINSFFECFVFNIIILFIKKYQKADGKYNKYLNYLSNMGKNFFNGQQNTDEKIATEVEDEIISIVKEILKIVPFNYDSTFKILKEKIDVSNLDIGKNYFEYKNLINGKTSENEVEDPIVEKYINIIVAVWNFYDEGKKLSFFKEETKEKLVLDFTSLNTEKISTLLSEIKFNSIQDHFFTYDFDIKFSSGEKGLITLFSRVLNKKETIEELKQNEILFLLDEPDIFAHPEWQRNLINNVKLGLEKIFNNSIKFQIILTSHSPFIASDLPIENVIMLDVYEENDKETKKNEEDPKYQKVGNCKVIKNKKIKTFGANIFDLYKDAFFVNDIMGEFAKNKITKEVIDKLKTDNLTSEDFKNIEYIINLIGDEVLSSILKNKIKDKRIVEGKKPVKDIINNFSDEEREEALKLLNMNKRSDNND